MCSENKRRDKCINNSEERFRTSMKKVVFFTNGLTGFGGAERVMLNAARHFQKKGVCVYVVAFVVDRKAFPDYINELNIINLNTKSLAKRVFKLKNLLNKINPDLVIGQSSLDCLYIYLVNKISLCSLSLCNHKYISYVHGSLFWLENDFFKYAAIHKGVFNKIRKSVQGHMEFVPRKLKLAAKQKIFFNIAATLEYFGVKKAKAIIVLTKQIQWEVKKLYNKKSIVIRGCIDKGLFNYKSKIDIRKRHNLKNKKIILNIGRLDPRKRIDVLIKAFFNLAPKHKNLVLMIGGKGPDRERLDAILNEPKYSRFKNRVIMLGFVKDEEYFDYMAAADIFAFPSWTTSGIPTYEALALGKKVIWSSEAEEPVLIHPNVYVAEPNEYAFTAAIEKALDNKLHKKPNLEKHTWNRYFGRLFEVASDVSNRQ